MKFTSNGFGILTGKWKFHNDFNGNRWFYIGNSYKTGNRYPAERWRKWCIFIHKCYLKFVQIRRFVFTSQYDSTIHWTFSILESMSKQQLWNYHFGTCYIYVIKCLSEYFLKLRARLIFLRYHINNCTLCTFYLFSKWCLNIMLVVPIHCNLLWSNLWHLIFALKLSRSSVVSKSVVNLVHS